MKRSSLSLSLALALSLAALSAPSHAYELLDRYFNATFEGYEDWVIVRCDNGSVLKVHSPTDPLQACEEGLIRFPDRGNYEVIRE